MTKWNWRILAGGGLILMGVIALLDAVFQVELSGMLWSALFLLGGSLFWQYWRTTASSGGRPFPALPCWELAH